MTVSTLPVNARKHASVKLVLPIIYHIEANRKRALSWAKRCLLDGGGLYALLPFCSRTFIKSCTPAQVESRHTAWMKNLPNIVTHTYHPGPGPFLNLCALDDAEADVILTRMRREFGRCKSPDYLARRKRTEEWLRSASIAKGIGVKMHHPIYFFLGDFDDGLDPARPAAITAPLADFPTNVITFTYGDSMDCVDGPAPYNHVFTYHEIQEFIRQTGIPHPGRSSDSLAPIRRAFIEMQVWDGEPLGQHLSI